MYNTNVFARRLFVCATSCAAICGGGLYLKKRYAPVWQEASFMLSHSKSIGRDWNRSSLYNMAACASSPVQVPISSKVKSNVEFVPGTRLTLFQYVTCPFCCKVRAYLDYLGVAYDIVEINSVTRRQFDSSWTGGSKKVPVLVLSPQTTTAHSPENAADDFVILCDSSVIVSVLESFRLQNAGKINSKKNLPWTEVKAKISHLQSCYPQDPESTNKRPVFLNRYRLMFGESLPSQSDYNFRKNESEWREWVDQVFVHTISPNLYRTLSESFHTFRIFSQRGKWDELFYVWENTLVIYVGGVVMYGLSKMLRKKYNLKENVRDSLMEQAQTWTAEALLDGKKEFAGGSTPHLGDLAMFGVVSSMEGLEALEEMESGNKQLATWLKSMRHVAPHLSELVYGKVPV